MHQLAEYFKEWEGFDSIVTDDAFASYRIVGEECYIREIWVRPELRKTGLASDIADQIAVIAKERGCAFLSGSVNTLGNKPTESTKVLLAYGFKISGAVPNGILFKKELE